MIEYKDVHPKDFVHQPDFFETPETEQDNDQTERD